MIELVLIVCLANEPNQCKDVHLTYAEELATTQQCLMRSQPQIAQWINEQNAVWTVKRWYCGEAGRRLKDI